MKLALLLEQVKKHNFIHWNSLEMLKAEFGVRFRTTVHVNAKGIRLFQNPFVSDIDEAHTDGVQNIVSPAFGLVETIITKSIEIKPIYTTILVVKCVVLFGFCIVQALLHTISNKWGGILKGHWLSRDTGSPHLI